MWKCPTFLRRNDLLNSGYVNPGENWRLLIEEEKLERERENLQFDDDDDDGGGRCGDANFSSKQRVSQWSQNEAGAEEVRTKRADLNDLSLQKTRSSEDQPGLMLWSLPAFMKLFSIFFLSFPEFFVFSLDLFGGRIRRRREKEIWRDGLIETNIIKRTLFPTFDSFFCPGKMKQILRTAKHKEPLMKEVKFKVWDSFFGNRKGSIYVTLNFYTFSPVQNMGQSRLSSWLQQRVRWNEKVFHRLVQSSFEPPLAPFADSHFYPGDLSHAHMARMKTERTKT